MLNFGETYIEKRKFHTLIKPPDINDAKIQNILTSNKYSIRNKCFKYFIGYAIHSNGDMKPFLIW